MNVPGPLRQQDPPVPASRSPRGAARRAVVAAVAALATALALLGCSAPVTQDLTIALLLPEVKTARYEGVDRPAFVDAVAATCATCTVLYANAQQDAARQQQQAESFLIRGADVLVLAAVDAEAALGIVAEATTRGVPVIAYDRFLEDPDVAYYISFDPGRVGQLQAQSLVDGLEERGITTGGVLLTYGAVTDANSPDLRRSVETVMAASDLTVLAETTIPDWSPDKAQEWVATQMSRYRDQVVGVYAANDGLAAGAISAIRAAGVTDMPLVTGQDAELAAVQRIVAGEQYMTVYKSIRQQAQIAAGKAVSLARGEEIDAPTEVRGVPTMLLSPVAVTLRDIEPVLVRQGVFGLDEICVEPYAQACAAAGLTEEELR